MNEPAAPARDTRRPCLAYPFTILTQPNTVRVVAGEDHRYTLTGPGIERWLPELLSRCTGTVQERDLRETLSERYHDEARAVIERLYGERVLVDGPVLAAHRPRECTARWAGRGPLYERLAQDKPSANAVSRITVLCQDRLDFAEAIDTSRHTRAAGESYLWISHAAVSRAYVSPQFLPDAGPCFECLLRTFERLSPMPEVYEALIDHGRQNRKFTPAEIPDDALDVLHGLVHWKLTQAELEQPSATLYRLHVLELATMEVKTHQVFVDPECPGCHGGRR